VPARGLERRTAAVVAHGVGAVVGRGGGGPPAPRPNAGAVRGMQSPEEGAPGGHREAPVAGL
jgi:hypothetical protein